MDWMSRKRWAFSASSTSSRLEFLAREYVNAEGSELLLKECFQVWYIPHKDVHDSHRSSPASSAHSDDALDGDSPSTSSTTRPWISRPEVRWGNAGQTQRPAGELPPTQSSVCLTESGVMPSFEDLQA